MTPCDRDEKFSSSDVLQDPTARQWQRHTVRAVPAHAHPMALFGLCFWKRRGADQRSHKPNVGSRGGLFLLGNTELDPRCKPPTRMCSKQIKELRLKSHVLGKYQKTEQNVYQMCGGGITSSALEAITEDGRLTDSNIYALISSAEGSIIKPK